MFHCSLISFLFKETLCVILRKQCVHPPIDSKLLTCCVIYPCHDILFYLKQVFLRIPIFHCVISIACTSS